MKHTFILKEPNSKKETLIYFSCHFGRKFKYSTGEKILPEHWDRENHQPKKKGARDAESIRKQLNRYSDVFMETESLYKRIKEEFNAVNLKSAFDAEFKKGGVSKSSFFDAWDEYSKEKWEKKEWSKNTFRAYTYVKGLLKDFESEKNYPMTFSRINGKFQAGFTTYCLDDLEQANNSLSRNLALIKTFMKWAVSKKYTFNTDFVNIIRPNTVYTSQVSLTLKDIEKIMSYELRRKGLEKTRDIFVFACLTGMRFSELSLVNKSNVTETHILIKEQKDMNKSARKIPLTVISRAILSKYDCKLPMVTNHLYNIQIREVFRLMGYTQTVEKITVRGKDSFVKEVPFCDRVGSHTARRTFITIMKREGKSDKLIASITGHKNMKTLNDYYQVDSEEKAEAVNEVFNLKIPLRKVGG